MRQEGPTARKGRGGMAQSVGVIGLGNMGGAMAANLLSAGFQVVGCDPSATACRLSLIHI